MLYKYFYLLKAFNNLKYSFLFIVLSDCESPTCSENFKNACGLNPCFFNDAIVGNLLSSQPEYFPALISFVI